MPGLLERRAKLDVVVDLPVVDDADSTFAVAHGLVCVVAQIQHLEPARPEPHALTKDLT